MAAGHVRIGIIGWGRIAPKHAEVFRHLGSPIACSMNRSEAGRRAAQEAGIEATYDSIETMMERERPDGVLCSASFDAMLAVAEKLFLHRVPVLMEKPPGSSLAAYERIASLAAEHTVPVMVALNRRHYSVLSRAIEDAGGLDQVRTVTVLWSEDPQHLLGRFSREQVEKAVFANSIHGLDLMAYLAGPIRAPHVLVRTGEGFERAMSLGGISDRGVLCHFESTWDAPARWRVDFTTLGRRYTFAPLESCRVLEKDGERTIDPSADDLSFKAGFLAQARAFLEVCGGAPVPSFVSLEAARPGMDLAERLTASFRPR
jgi:predicted dehydrogenase